MEATQICTNFQDVIQGKKPERVRVHLIKTKEDLEALANGAKVFIKLPEDSRSRILAYAGSTSFARGRCYSFVAGQELNSMHIIDAWAGNLRFEPEIGLVLSSYDSRFIAKCHKDYSKYSAL